MLVDGGFFWLICQCLFLNAPTMYYYHVEGNNITNLSLSLSTLGFLLWGTRAARVRRMMGKGQQSAQLCRSLWSGWMPSAADDYDPRQTGSSIDRRRVGIAGQLSSLTQLSPLQKWSGLYYDLDLFFLDLEHTLEYICVLFLNGFSKLRVEGVPDSQLLNRQRGRGI